MVIIFMEYCSVYYKLFIIIIFNSCVIMWSPLAKTSLLFSDAVTAISKQSTQFPINKIKSRPTFFLIQEAISPGYTSQFIVFSHVTGSKTWRAKHHGTAAQAHQFSSHFQATNIELPLKKQIKDMWGQMQVLSICQNISTTKNIWTFKHV